MAVSRAVVWNALQQAGLAPSAASGCQTFLYEELATDLLPMLVSVWRIRVEQQCQRREQQEQQRALRMLHRLENQQSRGARLTLGMPGPAHERVEHWLGPRLCWWTHGVPAGRLFGLVSSRLGRRLDEKPDWFRTLRTACVRLDPDRDILVSATSTTTFRFIQRCATLFDLPTLRIDTIDSGNWRIWNRRIRTFSDANEACDEPTVFVSPCLDPAIGASREIVETPVRDRAVVAMSEQLMVMHLRRRGNLHRLIRARLADAAWPDASVYLALGESLVPQRVAQELQDAGAVGWILIDTQDSADESIRTPDGGTSDSGWLDDDMMPLVGTPVADAAAIVPMPSTTDWGYLTHCTRRHTGPWPDQSPDSYIDDLLFESPQADHSSLATLKRIVRQRMIWASTASIRGGYRVVSLTAVPLSELDRRHVFRAHRGRWDFEPYGICIRREWLERCGARPVLYGNDQLWQSLSEGDRPFFQLEGTRPSEKENTINWSVEQEWRHLGDLDLSVLPPDAGLLFVPTEPEAEQLAAIAPWPVTIL